jgi:hypothetical protein
MENVNVSVASPSLTVMVMFPVEPTLAAVGVPVTLPVADVKVSQLGRFWIV